MVTGENGDQHMSKMAIPIIKELDSQVDAFIAPNDQLGSRRPFAEAIWANSSKPLIGIVKNDVMESWGATAVIYPSNKSMGQQAGKMVKRLLAGEPISTIIPEWPMKYGYAVNLPKARHFNMSVPIGILQLAGKNIIKR